MDTMQNVMMVEIDEDLFGKDLFTEEVLGEFDIIFGDDAEAVQAAEAMMREAMRKASAEAKAEADLDAVYQRGVAQPRRTAGKKGRKKLCPVVSCPDCGAVLCVVRASSSTQRHASPARKINPTTREGHPQSGSDLVPPPPPARTRVVGAVALLRTPAAAQSASPPKALVQTGGVFSGVCPGCGANLDLTVAAQSAGASQNLSAIVPTVQPMTVREILGDEWVEGGEAIAEDAVLREILGQTPSPNVPSAPTGQSTTPAWQRYVNLASELIPAAVSTITDIAKPGSAAKEQPPSTPKPPSPKSFFMQGMGPLPVWGWGVVVATAGGGLLYWMKRRKT